MPSSKHTFAAGTFRAHTFACGTLRGTGLVPVFRPSLRLDVAGTSRMRIRLDAVSRQRLEVRGT